MNATIALAQRLGTRVHHEAGPLTPAQLLPGMHVRVQHGADTRTGRLCNRVLHGLTLETDRRGQVALADTRKTPMSSWHITLLEDFEELLITPGTCAAGSDRANTWRGLWLYNYAGTWEPVRPFDGHLLVVDEQTVDPINLHPVPAPSSTFDEGTLALVEICGERHRATCWTSAWRIPAVGYTATPGRLTLMAALLP